MKHTKEPWSSHMLGGGKGGHPNHYSIRAPGDDGCAGYGIAEFRGQNDGKNGWNARRAVDCVNAMEGIEDPAEFVRKAKASAEVELARDAVVEAADVISRFVSPRLKPEYGGTKDFSVILPTPDAIAISRELFEDLITAKQSLDAAEAKAREAGR
jgi:hypothetical protein